MYTIYATGDGRFMYEVFQSIALIFDTSSFIGLISVGFLLQVIILTVKAIQNQKLELHHLMVSFIMYGVLFVPKGDVAITDIHTSQTRVVANVPLGLAAGGELMSTAGYAITNLFETNFAPVSLDHASYNGVLDDGYLAPLKLLLKLREIPLDSGDKTQIAADNIRNYIAQCSLKKLDAGMTTIQKIRSEDDAWDELKHPIHTASMTHVGVSTGAPAVVSCYDATTLISADLDRSAPFYNQALEELNASSGYALNDGDIPIQGAIDQYLGVSIDAYQYIINASISSVFEDGLAMGNARRNDIAATITIQEAKTRRNIAYAAEASIFATIMKPMMSFIEVLIYAVSPLMAFLIVAGPAGIGLAAKYLTLGAWVQLWLPLLAIVKLYIYLVMTQQIDELVSGKPGVTHSIAAQFAYNDTMGGYIGIASMLVSAVPAIALMLIYGGAVTATNLAGKLSSSGFVNSSGVAPSTVSASAGKASSGLQDAAYDSAQGGSIMGRSSLDTKEIGGISVGESLSGSLSTGITRATEIANNSATEAGRILGQSSAVKTAIQTGHSNTAADNYTSSEALKAMDNAATSAGFSGYSDLSKSQKRALALSMVAQAGYNGGGLSKGGVKAGFAAAARMLSEASEGQSDAQKAAFDNVRQFSDNEAISKAFSESLAASEFTGKSEGYDSALTKQENHSVKEALSRSEKATEAAASATSEQAKFEQSPSAMTAPSYARHAKRFAENATGQPVGEAAAVKMFNNEIAKRLKSEGGAHSAAQFIRDNATIDGVTNSRMTDIATAFEGAGDTLDKVKALGLPKAKVVDGASRVPGGGFAELSDDVAEQGGKNIAGMGIDPAKIQGGINTDAARITTAESNNHEQSVPKLAFNQGKEEHAQDAANLQQRSALGQEALFDQSMGKLGIAKGGNDPGAMAQKVLEATTGSSAAGAAVGRSISDRALAQKGLAIAALAGAKYERNGGDDYFANGGKTQSMDSRKGFDNTTIKNVPHVNPSLLDANQQIPDPNSEKGKDLFHTMKDAAHSGSFHALKPEHGDENLSQLELSGPEHTQMSAVAEQVSEALNGNSNRSIGEIYETALTQQYAGPDTKPEDRASPAEVRSMAETATNETLRGNDFLNMRQDMELNAATLLAMQEDPNINADWNGAARKGIDISGNNFTNVGSPGYDQARDQIRDDDRVGVSDKAMNDLFASDGKNEVPVYGENAGNGRAGQAITRADVEQYKKDNMGELLSMNYEKPGSRDNGADAHYQQILNKDSTAPTNTQAQNQSSSSYFENTTPEQAREKALAAPAEQPTSSVTGRPSTQSEIDLTPSQVTSPSDASSAPGPSWTPPPLASAPSEGESATPAVDNAPAQRPMSNEQPSTTATQGGSASSGMQSPAPTVSSNQSAPVGVEAGQTSSGPQTNAEPSGSGVNTTPETQQQGNPSNTGSGFSTGAVPSAIQVTPNNDEVALSGSENAPTTGAGNPDIAPVSAPDQPQVASGVAREPSGVTVPSGLGESAPSQVAASPTGTIEAPAQQSEVANVSAQTQSVSNKTDDGMTLAQDASGQNQAVMSELQNVASTSAVASDQAQLNTDQGNRAIETAEQAIQDVSDVAANNQGNAGGGASVANIDASQQPAPQGEVQAVATQTQVASAQSEDAVKQSESAVVDAQTANEQMRVAVADSGMNSDQIQEATAQGDRALESARESEEQARVAMGDLQELENTTNDMTTDDAGFSNAAPGRFGTIS